MKIRFSNHALQKFMILKKHNFIVKEEDVIKVIKEPEKVEKGRKGRLIAQRETNMEHVLRVVYEEKDNEIVVITFYPARRKRYEG